jgi:hypothetical protein
MNSEEIAPLFREAQTKDAASAVCCGIVHEVRDVQIPPGGLVFSLVFQRQRAGLIDQTRLPCSFVFVVGQGYPPQEPEYRIGKDSMRD